MTIKVLSPAQKQPESKGGVSKHQNTLPISPLRALCIQKLHQQYEAETTTISRQRLGGLDISARMRSPETTQKGLIVGQKLEPHTMKTMYGQNDATFPKCKGVTRCYQDEHMYPQYGNLRTTMFGPRPPPHQRVLQQRRDELRMTRDAVAQRVQNPTQRTRAEGRRIHEGTIHARRNETLAEVIVEQLRVIQEKKKEVRDKRLAAKKDAMERTKESDGN